MVDWQADVKFSGTSGSGIWCLWSGPAEYGGRIGPRPTEMLLGLGVLHLILFTF